MIWPILYEIPLRMQLNTFESLALVLAKRAALRFLIVLQATDVNPCVICVKGQMHLYCLLIGLQRCFFLFLVV